MKDAAHPIVLYVPGLLPKPEPGAHREALFRCLLAGLERLDEPVAEAVAATTGGFDIVSWTYDFYREHRDIANDVEAIEHVINQPTASERDIAEASSWRRRLSRWIYTLGDRLPFLIPHIASERTELHLRDLHRYVDDDNGYRPAHTAHVEDRTARGNGRAPPGVAGRAQHGFRDRL